MPQDNLPPLRIRENDGSPNVIPVFDIILSSNLTMENKGGGIVSISATTGAGGTAQDPITFPLIVGSGGTGIATTGSATTILGVNTSGVVFDYYHLIASDNLTILRANSAYFFSAVTNAAGSNVVYAATGNDYVVMNLAGDLTNEYRLVQSGNSITITTAAGLITINASTGVTQVVYAPTGGEYLTYAANATLTAERVIAASDNITIVSSGTSFLISAVTSDISGKQDTITYPLGINSGGTGRTTATSANLLVGINSDGLVYDYFAIKASDNVTIVRLGTNILISAVTNALGTGSVSTGSQNYLAFYPSAGTTVDDVTISVSTGNGVAPFNVVILTANAASLAVGDFWFQSSSNKLYLACRSSNATYFVELGS